MSIELIHHACPNHDKVINLQNPAVPFIIPVDVCFIPTSKPDMETIGKTGSKIIMLFFIISTKSPRKNSAKARPKLVYSPKSPSKAQQPNESSTAQRKVQWKFKRPNESPMKAQWTFLWAVELSVDFHLDFWVFIGLSFGLLSFHWAFIWSFEFSLSFPLDSWSFFGLSVGFWVSIRLSFGLLSFH